LLIINCLIHKFTSDDVELPRTQVTDYLEKIDPAISTPYIEYLINEKGVRQRVLHSMIGWQSFI
jgi:hypothetical protein